MAPQHESNRIPVSLAAIYEVLEECKIAHTLPSGRAIEQLAARLESANTAVVTHLIEQSLRGTRYDHTRSL